MVRLVLELTFVFRAVKVAFRVLDEFIVIKLPKFVAADSNAFSRAAWHGVGSSQCPMKLRSVRVSRDIIPSSQAKIRYFTFAIFTILPFACESFGFFTTVTYNSFSPSPNATFVVPSPAAISNTCRSLPSGDIFKILPPNH